MGIPLSAKHIECSPECIWKIKCDISSYTYSFAFTLKEGKLYNLCSNFIKVQVTGHREKGRSECGSQFYLDCQKTKSIYDVTLFHNSICTSYIT